MDEATRNAGAGSTSKARRSPKCLRRASRAIASQRQQHPAGCAANQSCPGLEFAAVFTANAFFHQRKAATVGPRVRHTRVLSLKFAVPMGTPPVV